MPTVADFAALPLSGAKADIHKAKLAVEKELRVAAFSLPASMFVGDIHGFGILGFAMIIGEAGDLSRFPNPAKLWKWMGLSVMLDGRSHRRVKGVQDGYCPRRRSVMHVIGDSLIKRQNIYRELYLSRKEFEKNRDSEISKGHAHMRALRYAEKRLLRDLWRYWRDLSKIDNHGSSVEPVSSPVEAA
jgi:hypothetical protein